MNDLMNISGMECYEKDGTAYLNLETVSRGLGFTKTADSGNEVVNWTRVRSYLADFGVVQKCTTGDFIPENIFYRLAMKAKNATAEAFQAKVADEIIPAIRKHGAYMTPDTIQKVLSDPDTIIQLATQLKFEQEQRKTLELENAYQKQQIGELQPKASYVDRILDNKGLVTITQIAKDYGMSGQAMNRKLHEMGIQYNQSGQWLLYSKYHSCGYTHSKTIQITRSDGRPDVTMETKWTQKGRLFLYEELKKIGIFPVVERS